MLILCVRVCRVCNVAWLVPSLPSPQSTLLPLFIQRARWGQKVSGDGSRKAVTSHRSPRDVCWAGQRPGRDAQKSLVPACLSTSASKSDGGKDRRGSSRCVGTNPPPPLIHSAPPLPARPHPSSHRCSFRTAVPLLRCGRLTSRRSRPFPLLSLVSTWIRERR